MIYLSPQGGSLPASRQSRHWGQITTPQRWSNSVSARQWAMDNGVFTGRFDESAFWKKLERLQPHQPQCLFVVAPDVVANAIATLSAWRYWGPAIHAAGWPVAFVAQDGQENLPLPPEFDALFIGGSTEWKMSNYALALIAEAKRRGAWVHVGRVNSQSRIRHFQLAGVDSVDGTTICFAPNKYYPVIDRALRQRPLFVVEG